MSNIDLKPEIIHFESQKQACVLISNLCELGLNSASFMVLAASSAAMVVASIMKDLKKKHGDDEVELYKKMFDDLLNEYLSDN